MTEALPQHLVYFDSNLFIYYLEGETPISEPLRQLFSLLRGQTGIAVTSELTLAEVLAPATVPGSLPLQPRPGSIPLHVKRRLYLDLIVWNGIIDLKPVSRSILYDTAELRRVSRHKLPDAIHIVTAVQSGCTYFMSSDHDTKRLPVGMKHLEADGAGVQELIEHLNV